MVSSKDGRGVRELYRRNARPIRQLKRRIVERYFLDYLFIHINKTGGSSVEKALRLPFEHKTALEKIEEVGRRAWDRKFTFAFVRNPWDRVVSHYHYRVVTNQTQLQEHPVPFTEWVRLTYGEQDPRYYGPKMFMPQSRWITDGEGNVLVSFVGRFERLEQDFAVVCDRVGVSSPLPHLKPSERGAYANYYDPATREIVARWFAEDIERFGYRF